MSVTRLLLCARPLAATSLHARGFSIKAGTKEQAIRERFGISATRYYQMLNALIDSPAALAAEPAVVKRLQSLRKARRAAGATHED